MREKRIVLVNDVTGLSRCSVACQLPIISAMGIETAFVPTAILSINTYHKDFFFDDYTSKMNDYIETYKSIKEKGIGKISSLEDISKNNINNIFIYNEQKIYEFIIVFVFIIMSIGGYNTLANLEYKRLLTIYYITGITWKKGIALLTIRNFIIIVIPTIISSIFSNKIVTYLRTLYTYNEKNVYITLFIYIGIFILTTAVTVIGLRDKKPIEVLREVD